MKRIYLAAALCFLTLSVLPVSASTPPAAPAPEAAQTSAAAQPDNNSSTARYDDMKARADYAKTLVVARVGEVEITYFDLIKKMNLLLKKEFPQGVKDLSDEITDRIKKDALDKLTLEALARNEALRQGINIPAERVDNVLTKMREAYGGEEGYRQYLSEKGITEDELRAGIERNQRLQLITKKEVFDKIMIDPVALQKLYDEYKAAGRLHKGDEFYVQEMVIMGDLSALEARKKAEVLREKIVAHNNEMGKLVLKDVYFNSHKRINRKQFPVMCEQIANMEEGELSPVVEDNGKVRIFKLVKKEPARDLTLDESRDFLENRLRYDTQEERKQQWYDELRRNGKAEVLLDEVDRMLGGKK